MRMSALAARRAALVERLVEAAYEVMLNHGLSRDELRARFTALLASRWQT